MLSSALMALLVEMALKTRPFRFGLETFAKSEETVLGAASTAKLYSLIACAVTVMIIRPIAKALVHCFILRDDAS